MQASRVFSNVSAVVAIPVRDEAERIADCMGALSRQPGPAGVLLLVNNTTDQTCAVIREVSGSLDCPVVVVEHRFSPALANAGQARRMAMEQADRLAPPGLPLLCTDADGRVQPGWLAGNLRHLAEGADAVFGRAEIDAADAERIPPGLQQADADECAYAALLDEIEHLVDPDPWDPWPRHTEHSGASIAVSRAAYRAVGGIPPVALGEDRAFAAALRRADARVRHAPEVRVVVSGRILGRAVGGMADTIRRRLVTPDVLLDDALEPVVARLARLRRRRAARESFIQVEAAPLRRARRPSFGAAWAAVDALVPAERLRVVALPEEMEAALRVRDGLRASQAVDAEALV